MSEREEENAKKEEVPDSPGISRASSGGGESRRSPVLQREIPNRVVKLNVGGKQFVTTSMTLTDGQDNFFSGLLSGSFGSFLLDDGSYFIDRDGKAFGTILEFLRTGTLDMEILEHDGCSLAKLLIESNFFLIDDLTKQVEELLAERAKKEQEEQPEEEGQLRLAEEGAYICHRYDDNGTQQAISFRYFANAAGGRLTGRLTVCTGSCVRDTILVTNLMGTDLCRIWGEEDRIKHRLAVFFHKQVVRGIYWREGRFLKLMVSQERDGTLMGVLVDDGKTILVEKDGLFLRYSFESVKY